MMFRKWMIGACVAVAAMVGSAVATAQTAEKVGHQTVYVKFENRTGRSVIGTVIVPEDEDAAKTSGAAPGENAAKGPRQQQKNKLQWPHSLKGGWFTARWHRLQNKGREHTA
jgi:hypothetical protein